MNWQGSYLVYEGATLPANLIVLTQKQKERRKYLALSLGLMCRCALVCKR